ncbi:MAG: organomercurial lyase MerB [Gammaproteobacteria bacterium]|nr:MAG: organomercurial lyase MerB [Gammaproteobacteria bacterium]
MATATLGGTHAPLIQPRLDELARVFINAFPLMNADEQRLALILYHRLAEGEPVAVADLARTLDQSVESVQTVLESWPGVFFDDDHRIQGFWGLTVMPMHHQFKVDGRTVYTWCAWDALFIPELLNRAAEVTSRCGTTGESIRMTITPDGIKTSTHKGVMVSFLTPDEDELEKNITASFCHFVYLFRDRSAGEQWVAEHEGTFLLPIEDAFTVGKKMNAIRYKQTLTTLGS